MKASAKYWCYFNRAGDISSLRIQVIVHSTNESLTDRSPLSDRLLRKAGPQLKEDLIMNVKGNLLILY